MNKFKIQPADIEDLIEPMGYCYASDRITVDGKKVGFMYREKPYDKDDSGWRFIAGTENQEYLDDPKNSFIFEVNVIANYDKAIIPYLHGKIGTELLRVAGEDTFIPLNDQ